jgi:hypothetical protein
MNRAINGLLMVFLITGGSGCVSSYKHVLVRAVDSNTGKPVSGAAVSTSYIGRSALSRASRRISKAVTDGTGSAMLLANYLPAEPGLFGVLGEMPFEPMYSLTISNKLYEADQGLMVSLTQLAGRPGDFLPTEADLTFKITSKKDLARLEADAAAKRLAAEQLADKLFRESPGFWPERTNDVAEILFSKRWDHASEKALGSNREMDSIRAAIISHMKHPKSEVHEIRWISATVVMAKSSWYTGPLGAAGYTYVLQKSEQGWTVLTCAMDYIS